MVRSGFRPLPPRGVLTTIVVVTLLTAACGGGGDGETAASGHGGSPSELRAFSGGGVDGADRCDLGFNTSRYNETTELVHHHEHAHDGGDPDFTLDEWAGVFVDEDLGMSADEAIDDMAPDEIYVRHVLGGVLTHTLDAEPWMPMTDPAQCEALAGELQATREVAFRYPTAADAVAGGYQRMDRYFAGLGVHYQNFRYHESFDPANPGQLLYDGMEPDARLVGVSYVVRRPDGTPPEGFSGVNDRWHLHRHFCMDLDDGNVNLSSDVLTPEECAAIGGTHIPNPEGWMLHVWLVPGCESDWGTFSGANPRLPYIPANTVFASGCNSGKSFDARPDLDRRGGGPTVR